MWNIYILQLPKGRMQNPNSHLSVFCEWRVYMCIYIYSKKVKTLFDTFFSFYFFFYGRNKIQTISNWHPFVKQSNFEWFSSFFACVLFECRFIYLQPFFSNGKKRWKIAEHQKEKQNFWLLWDKNACHIQILYGIRVRVDRENNIQIWRIYVYMCTYI